MKKGLFGLAMLSAGVLFLAVAGNVPAFAKDRDDWRNSSRREIANDIRDVRHDEAQLAALENRLSWQRRHRDYRAAQRTEDEIRALRRHIESDRREIRRDFRDARHDDGYRNDRYNDNRSRNYRREYRR
jgi:hypothetical protein